MENKSELELFKQALSEGLSNKFDSIANSCTEKITYSEKHKLAMRTIIYGKTDQQKVWSSKRKKIIAVLIAVAVLLTSCGVVFRDEIRGLIEEITDFYIKLSYSDTENGVSVIDEIYEPTYIPEGYELKEEEKTPVVIRYHFENEANGNIWLEQKIKKGLTSNIDVENAYIENMECNETMVYYQTTKDFHNYLWSNEKYAFKLISSTMLSEEEISSIISGIIKK